MYLPRMRGLSRADLKWIGRCMAGEGASRPSVGQLAAGWDDFHAEHNHE